MTRSALHKAANDDFKDALSFRPKGEILPKFHLAVESWPKEKDFSLRSK
jgi:hypothetical protein